MWNEPKEFDALTAASLAAVRAARAKPADPAEGPADRPPSAASPYQPRLPKPGGDWEPFSGTAFP